jgi:hypothetical protein
MHPVDDVVADVHRVRVRRQHLHLERIAEAGRLERLVPPGRALDQRAANRLGRAVVHVVDDRLHRLGHGRRRVLLLQPVPHDPALLDRVGDRGRVVVELDAEHADTRIDHARRVAARAERRQLDEGMMLAQRHRLRRRRDLPDMIAGIAIRHERERRLDLRILRKPLRPRQIERAAALVEPIAALARLTKRVDGAEGVAEEEGGGVDEHARAFGGLHLEAPEHGLREGVAHGPQLGGIGADGAVAVVRLDHQDLGADPLEGDDVRVAERAAIEAHRIRAEAGRERCLIQQLGVEPRDLHPHLALRLVPVDRDEAVDLRERTHALVYRLGARRAGSGGRRSAGGRRGALGGGERHAGQTREQATAHECTHDYPFWAVMGVRSSCRSTSSDTCARSESSRCSFIRSRAATGLCVRMA